MEVQEDGVEGETPPITVDVLPDRPQVSGGGGGGGCFATSTTNLASGGFIALIALLMTALFRQRHVRRKL
jgi:hypothetical protein